MAGAASCAVPPLPRVSRHAPKPAPAKAPASTGQGAPSPAPCTITAAAPARIQGCSSALPRQSWTSSASTAAEEAKKTGWPAGSRSALPKTWPIATIAIQFSHMPKPAPKR